MNPIEIWFSVRARKLLKTDRFISVADHKAKGLAFVKYFNRIMAKPFCRTYQASRLPLNSRLFYALMYQVYTGLGRGISSILGHHFPEALYIECLPNMNLQRWKKWADYGGVLFKPRLCITTNSCNKALKEKSASRFTPKPAKVLPA